jgi:hypothetical protein
MLGLVILFRTTVKSTALSILAYALSALCFVAAILSRMDVVILFYGFGLSLYLSGHYSRRTLVLKYAYVSFFFAILLLVYYLVTSINPFETFTSGMLGKIKTYLSLNIYNSLLFSGTFGVLIVISLFNYKHKYFLFALSLMLVTTLPIFILLSYIVPRYFYLSFLPIGLLSCIGLIYIKRIVQKLFGSSWATTLPPLTVLVFIAINAYIATNLIDVGVNSRPLKRIMDFIIEDHHNPLVIVDSRPNTFSYLKVSYPEIDSRHMSHHISFEPRSIRTLEDLQAEGQNKPVIYISAYGKVPNLIRDLYGKISPKGSEDPVTNRNILYHPGVTLEEICTFERYTAFSVIF